MEITAIESALAPLRDTLRNHRLYKDLDALKDVKIFMEHHVYAVWDFMSLLKALQVQLTCTELPWKPVGNTNTARFINEIVLEEETDRNEVGVYRSHFEMYLEAMTEVGANTHGILNFLDSITTMDTVMDDIHAAELQEPVKQFLQFTFATISSGKAHKIAAAFTFGREELIPDMFLKIVEDKHAYPKMEYYLRRHIELDGDDHGPLSIKMIRELCGTDSLKWNEVLDVSQKALQLRIQLWDHISSQIAMQKHGVRI